MKIPKAEALIVVDVQPNFPAAETVIAAVQTQVRKAMREGLHIVFLEYEGDWYSPTFSEITDLAEKYEYKQVVYKTWDDGSEEVADALWGEWGLRAGTPLRVCGVNTGACVADTAQGLAKKGFDVTVIQKACGDGDGYHDSQIELWHENPHLNVKVA
jgi:nicotinamidase-related amidase